MKADNSKIHKEWIPEAPDESTPWTYLGLVDRKIRRDCWWTERCQRFLFVSPYPIIVDGAFIMSHEPIYMNRNSPYYNIYGHVHDDERYPFYTPAGACVSVEKIEYTPVDIDLIKMRVFRDHDINKFENLINK